MRRRTILWAGKPLVIGSAGRTHWAALHGTFVLALLVIAEGKLRQSRRCSRKRTST